MNLATLGPVSEGTAGVVVMLEDFSTTLRALAFRAGRTDHLALCDAADRMLGLFAWDDEQAEAAEDMLLDKFPPALQKYAPPYCFFGPEGSYSGTWGFWPLVEDLLKEAERRDTVVSVAVGAAWPLDYEAAARAAGFGVLHAGDAAYTWLPEAAVIANEGAAVADAGAGPLWFGSAYEAWRDVCVRNSLTAMPPAGVFYFAAVSEQGEISLIDALSGERLWSSSLEAPVEL